MNEVQFPQQAQSASPPFAVMALQARQEMDEVAALAPRLGGLQPPQQPPQGQPGPEGAMPPQQMPMPPQPDAGPMPMQPQGPMPPPSGEPAPPQPGGGDPMPPSLDQALAQLSQRYMGAPSA